MSITYATIQISIIITKMSKHSFVMKMEKLFLFPLDLTLVMKN